MERAEPVAPVVRVVGAGDDVHPTAQVVQQAAERGGGVLERDDLHLDPGIAGRDPVPLCEQPIRRVHQGGADAHHRSLPALERTRFLQHSVRMADHLPGFVIDVPARLGQRKPAGAAVEQLDAKAIFEQVDLLGDGVGGDEQLFRRLEEAAAVGDCDKGVQMPVIHREPFFRFKP